MMLHTMAVVAGDAENTMAAGEQVVPVGGVGVQLVLDGAAGVPDFHGEIAAQHFKFARGRAAPFGVAVNGQVAAGMSEIEQLLRFFDA